ncbi:MAG: hypothetical protein KGD59_09510 [Candidatus Heimdallarchaeota archaeon]|nr:hypothetical protein [Candidatus Heimdallarchaeota archaeon]
MVKPGSIVGGFVIALSVAIQVITLVEIAHYYWLLFIWAAGLIAGVTYVLGGLAFDSDKMEYFTISGIGFGAIGALTAYFALFQGPAILNSLTDLIPPIQNVAVGWVFGAIGLSTIASFLVSIAPLFIVAGAGKQLKGVKPGALIGGILISNSLALQIITVIHLANYYWLLVFWFIGILGAISLAIGARSKWGYSSTEALVTAGVFIGILLVLVIWWTVSPQMISNITAKVAKPLGSGNFPAIIPTIFSFVAGVVGFFGVLFCAASDKRRF